MFKTAICQIRTEINQQETLSKAERMIRKAAANGADFAVLPEMFNCPYSREYFRKTAALGHEHVTELLSSLAGELKIYIVGGTIPESEDGKIYNTCFIYNRNGELIAKHRKVHLFDCDYPGLRVHESHTFTAGDSVTVFDTEFGKMGCAVCFDIRFPELWRTMQQRGARLVFFPSQFNMTTGPHHWESLTRSRAFDYQYFLVAAAAARYVGFSYECYGHSSVIDPFGKILTMAGEGEEILYCDIDLDEVDRVRASFPFTNLIRRDVYKVSE